MFQVLANQSNTLTALSLSFEGIDDYRTKALFETIRKISKLKHLSIDFGYTEWVGENERLPVDSAFTSLTFLKLKASFIEKPMFATFAGIADYCKQLQVRPLFSTFVAIPFRHVLSLTS